MGEPAIIAKVLGQEIASLLRAFASLKILVRDDNIKRGIQIQIRRFQGRQMKRACHNEPQKLDTGLKVAMG